MKAGTLGRFTTLPPFVDNVSHRGLGNGFVTFSGQSWT